MKSKHVSDDQRKSSTSDTLFGRGGDGYRGPRKMTVKVIAEPAGAFRDSIADDKVRAVCLRVPLREQVERHLGSHSTKAYETDALAT